MRIVPNFLVVGAGRSGTTSLHHYLAQHPEVFVPAKKSPSYFYAVDAPDPTDALRRLETADMFVRDADDYAALFEDAAGRKAIGEVSPAYLAATRVPDRIAAELPDVRIVAVVRNPSQRLISRFVARRRDGLETITDLGAIVERERRNPLPRDDAAGTYVAAGFVSHVLARYFHHFGRDRVRVYLYEDLASDPRALMRDLLDFLGVDPDAPIDLRATHNRSGGEITSPLRRMFWTRSAALRTRLRPYLPPALRDRAFAYFARHRSPTAIPPDVARQLAMIYRDEVERLERLLECDLSQWHRPPVDRL